MLKFIVSGTLRAVLCAAVFAAGVIVVPAALTAQQPYHVIAQWNIGGDGIWDGLIADSAAHRLYISRQTHIDVVDTTTGKRIGALGGLKGSFAIALDTARKFGFITDDSGHAIVVFDRASLATVTTIPVEGHYPENIFFEPTTQTAWAFDARSHSALVVDAATQKLIDTVALPGKPKSAVSDGEGTIYDNLEDKNEVIRIDARTRKVTAEWPAGCDAPNAIVMDVPSHRLFTTCRDGKTSILDCETGKLLTTLNIGGGPSGIGWSDKYHLILTAGTGGSLAVIDGSAAGFPAIENLPMPDGARNMTYDAGNDRVYAVTGKTIGFSGGGGPPPARAPGQQPGAGQGQQGPPPPGTPRPGDQGGQGSPQAQGQQGPQQGGGEPPKPAVVPDSFTVIVVGR